MSLLRVRAQTAAQYARAAADLLPQPPEASPRADVRSAIGWQLLVMETAANIAASVHYDASALRIAVGPALEVGVNPPWRVLLELALRVAEGGPSTRADAIHEVGASA